MRDSRRKGAAVRHGLYSQRQCRPQRDHPLGDQILGLYLGQNTMVPAIRIYQEKRLNMEPFFTKVIPLEEGLGAFEMLGLDISTLQHKPKSAMKIVMKFYGRRAQYFVPLP